MPLAHYHKAPVVPRYSQPVVKKPNHFLRLIPPTLITVGSLLVTTAIWPIVQYQLFVRPSLTPVALISPVGSLPQPSPKLSPTNFVHPQGQIAGISAAEETTLIDPKTWFPEADFSPGPKPITSYTLHIPKVDIESAKVTLDGQDLSQSLIQYPGTALPGEAGSPVIFGHSVLRQFYNPSAKNPDRYMSIFSKIMTLKTGDKVYLDYGETRYTYVVEEKVEVKPEDVFILEQRYSNNELKLITCVPEGTYLRRGVIIAQLLSTGPITDTIPENE